MRTKAEFSFDIVKKNYASEEFILKVTYKVLIMRRQNVDPNKSFSFRNQIPPPTAVVQTRLIHILTTTDSH